MLARHLRAEEHPPDVDIHQIIVLLFGHFEEVFGAEDAGVVDHDVNTTELFGGVDAFINVVPFRDVTYYERRVPLGLRSDDLVCGRSAFAWLRLDISDNDISAFLCESRCYFASVTARSTRNNSCFVSKHSV